MTANTFNVVFCYLLAENLLFSGALLTTTTGTVTNLERRRQLSVPDNSRFPVCVRLKVIASKISKVLVNSTNENLTRVWRKARLNYAFKFIRKI